MLEKIVLVCLVWSASAQDFVVAPGVDTLQAVLPKLRALPRPLRNDVSVQLLPGVHRITQPFIVDPAAGGDESHTIKFYGTNATVSGGVPITDWTAVTHSNGITPRSSVLWRATLPTEFDATPIGNRMQAWRGQQRLTLASSPTRRYVRAEASNITFNGTDIRASYHDQSSVLLLLWESWTASFHSLTRVDAVSHVAYLATHFNDQWANSASGSRFAVCNALEELDRDNEFYIDATSGEMFLQLPNGDDPNVKSGSDADAILLAGIPELVVVNGTSITAPVRGVTFEGLKFAHSAVETSPVAAGDSSQSASALSTATVRLRLAHRVTLDTVAVRATGGYAVWAEHGTADVLLRRSLLSDLGAGAVRFGRADATSPDCDGCVVQDSILKDGGHIWQQGCGVLAQKVANVTIEHNEIADFRYTGVSTGWTWGYGPTVTRNIITQFNHIHGIGQGFLSDMGCVYTLGHQPGSVVRNNFCSDVQSYNYGGWAFYTDEGSRDELFENNIGTRTKCAGHHQHYGTDNVLRNNIYYDVNIGDVPTPGRSQVLMPDCDTALRFSTHARNIESCHPHADPKPGCCCAPGCDQGMCASATVERNVVLQPTDAHPNLVDRTFVHGLDNFTFAKNTYFMVGVNGSTAALFNKTLTLAEWQAAGKDAGSIFRDPKLNTSTFVLSPSSPALDADIGFQPINISSVGPRLTRVGPQHATAMPAAPSGVERLFAMQLVHP
eukprot:g968.t1